MHFYFPVSLICDIDNGASLSFTSFSGFVGRLFFLDTSNNEKKTACTLAEDSGVFTYDNYPYGDTPDAVNCPVSGTTTPNVSVWIWKVTKL